MRRPGEGEGSLHLYHRSIWFKDRIGPRAFQLRDTYVVQVAMKAIASKVSSKSVDVVLAQATRRGEALKRKLGRGRR